MYDPVPASPQVYDTTQELSVSGGTGTGAVTFAVLSGPGEIVGGSQLRITAGTGTVTVQATKAAAAAAKPVVAALASGKQVCLADLRNLGETRWDAGQVRPEHEAARTALWLGRTMVGEWVEDLLAIAAALAPAAGDLALWTWGEPGIAALAATALGEGAFASVRAEAALATYVLDGQAHVQPMSVFIPGILNWGDLDLMAALATAPVELRSPVNPAGQALAAPACAALLADIRALAARLNRPVDVSVWA